MQAEPSDETSWPQAAKTQLRTRNMRTVLALAALFVLPVAASFWLYYGVGWSPASHVNRGDLIEPARPLPALSLPDVERGAAVPNVFTRRWSLVFVGPGSCDDACRHTLFAMRQTRLALARDMDRVQRVFLADSACCDRAYLERAYPGLIVLDASGSAARPLLEQFPPESRPSTVFIVDPLGNLMMRYDLRRDPKGLLQDLRRLLQLSNIG